MERITLNDLKYKITSEKKVFVLVLADWCGQCKMQKKIIKKYIENFKEIVFTELDTEIEKAWDHTEYQIKSVPTLLLFKDGKIKQKVEGYQYEKDFLSLLKQFKSL